MLMQNFIGFQFYPLAARNLCLCSLGCSIEHGNGQGHAAAAQRLCAGDPIDHWR